MENDVLDELKLAKKRLDENKSPRIYVLTNSKTLCTSKVKFSPKKHFPSLNTTSFEPSFNIARFNNDIFSVSLSMSRDETSDDFTEKQRRAYKLFMDGDVLRRDVRRFSKTMRIRYKFQVLPAVR